MPKLEFTLRLIKSSDDLGQLAERLDEETVKLAIGDLCERGLIGITETRRLAANQAGASLRSIIKT